MSFVRPEVSAAVRRWRETLVGIAVAALGLWWAFDAFGIWRWLALAVIVLGLAIAWEGVRRARFRPGSGGPGVVEVDERQVTYFGPTAGGTVSIDALDRVTILTGDAGRSGDALWIFEEAGGQRLVIPVAAAGAEQLFDAISALPGADFEAVLSAMSAPVRDRQVVWERVRRRLH